ncbi:exodeoxyribonuclease VII large subunit [Chitinophaga rhizosphaerae]|uniref:exodeoxyribonuclease VII large subunit n=1 Tax=Chitinophaga rhizosphaerae TaxID=1864947 RepID=UPI000F80A833|nr:exodeoxyribonuclease VII large subunit [Chitinophaga rhizosphaerae]
MDTIKEAENVTLTPAYGPGSILHGFSNTMTSPLLGKVLPIKGIYRAGKGVSYGGQFYDILKDETNDANITLVVPESIRQTITEGQLIEGAAYLNKRLNVGTGRLDLLLVLSEVFRKKEVEVDPVAQKTAALLRRKADHGYKDVNRLVKERLYKDFPIRIAVIIGQTAIVDQDILHQVKDAAVRFEMHFIRINLTRPQEIVAQFQQLVDVDFIVVTRGGGENLQVFDQIELAERALGLKAAFITAIGHAVDKTLLEKVADRSFITPTAFGQYLYDIYNQTMEEMAQSKSKLIGDISRQVELQFQSRLTDLTNRLNEATAANKQSQEQYQSYVGEMSSRIESLRSRNSVLVVVLIVVAIIALGIFLALR